MRVSIVVFFLFLLCLHLCCCVAASSAPAALDDLIISRDSNSTFLYHFVGFRFTNQTTEADKQAITDLYHSLLIKCPYIIDMKGGLPNSREGFQQQMDQGWVTIFRSVEDRDYFVGRPITYPYDPFHDEFKAFVGPHLLRPINLGLIVIDFVNEPFSSSNQSNSINTNSNTYRIQSSENYIPSSYLSSSLSPSPSPSPSVSMMSSSLVSSLTDVHSQSIPIPPRATNDTFVYHFVAFRFTNETSPYNVSQITKLYQSLLSKCPYIIDMVGGLPNSREGFQQQMDQGWVTIFRSVEDRDYFVGRPITYPYDPFHDEFKAFVGPFLRKPIDEGLLVVDFKNVNPTPYLAPFAEASWNWIDFTFESAQQTNQYYSSRSYHNVLVSGVKCWLDPRSNSSIVFLSFPRLKSNVPATLGFINKTASSIGNVSLAETPSVGPLISPFPSWQYNQEGDAQYLQSVLGFEIDNINNRMFILDQGRVENNTAIEDSIKIIVWDLILNQEIQRFVFPPSILNPATSFLNDIVLDINSNFCYISDSGTPLANNSASPAIIVYDIINNNAWKVLENDVSTSANSSFTFKINNTQVFAQVGVDGIALTPDGNWLFYTPLSSLEVYRIPTCLLRHSDPSSTASISSSQLSAAVKHVFTKPGNSDGLAFSNSFNTTVQSPDQALLTAYANWCNQQDLTSSPRYELIATDLINSAVWSIQGDLANTGVSTNSVSPSLLNISAIHQANDGTMQWPDTIGFNHLGSIYWISNHADMFNENKMSDWSQIYYRLWSRYEYIDTYIINNNNHSTPSSSSNHHLLYILLGVGAFFLLVFLLFCCKKHHQRKKQFQNDMDSLETASELSYNRQP